MLKQLQNFSSSVCFFSFVMPHLNATQRRIDLKLIDLICEMAGFRNDFRATALRTKVVTKFV